MAGRIPTLSHFNGSLIASQALGASATVSADFDARNALVVDLQAEAVFGGTVGAPSGLSVELYRGYGATLAGAVFDTEPLAAPVIPSTASATKRKTVRLEGSTFMRVTLRNLDAANALTSVKL